MIQVDSCFYDKSSKQKKQTPPQRIAGIRSLRNRIVFVSVFAFGRILIDGEVGVPACARAG
jgi:hypothetical protein